MTTIGCTSTGIRSAINLDDRGRHARTLCGVVKYRRRTVVSAGRVPDRTALADGGLETLTQPCPVPIRAVPIAAGPAARDSSACSFVLFHHPYLSACKTLVAVCSAEQDHVLIATANVLLGDPELVTFAKFQGTLLCTLHSY